MMPCSYKGTEVSSVFIIVYIDYKIYIHVSLTWSTQAVKIQLFTFHIVYIDCTISIFVSVTLSI